MACWSGSRTGLLAFIPIIGWLLGFITAASLAIVQFWPDLVPLVKVAAVLISGMAIDTAFLSPRFVGQKIGLHPVWLIFALFVFSYLFGLVGTLVAVPLAAATAVLVRFAVQVYLDSSVYKGNDAAPASARASPRTPHDRRAGPAHPRSAAPPGAGSGGLSHQRLEPGRRRHHRPLAGLAARVGDGGGAAGRRQDASGQRLALEIGRRRDMRASTLSEPDVAQATGALLIEDLHAGIGDQRALFHLLNLVREHKLSMLLTSRAPPGELDVSLPDLRSRLRALPVVPISPPDEALLKAVLVKHFADRQLARGAACGQLHRAAHGAIDGGGGSHRRRYRPARTRRTPQGDAGAGGGSAGSGPP